jgi:hypothetical protein
MRLRGPRSRAAPRGPPAARLPRAPSSSTSGPSSASHAQDGRRARLARWKLFQVEPGAVDTGHVTVDSKSGPAGHIGGGVGFGIIALATVGIVMIPRSPAPPASRPTATTPKRAPPAVAAFDATRAATGKDLHARLLGAANVDEFYLKGSLWGELMNEPKASIAVPLDAWRALGDNERAALMHYTASLVERMKADQPTYGLVSADAPAWSMARANVERMGPRSWVIFGGRLHRDADAGPFDILADGVVASGADRALTAGPK